MFKERSYRRWVESGDLVSFEIKEKETDLFISVEDPLLRLKTKLRSFETSYSSVSQDRIRFANLAREAVLAYRSDIERYALKSEEFYTALTPIDVDKEAPVIVQAMAAAAEKAGVGPMAAVAGAIAEFVGRGLLAFSKQVIIENGGDIFLKTSRKRIMGIYAGDSSPFTGNLAIEIEPNEKGLGVCTSSGTVSHSLSFGNADAALIISEDAALADAAATAAGNAVKSADDIEKAIGLARSIDGVKGVLILIGDKMGSWGEIKLI